MRNNCKDLFQDNTWRNWPFAGTGAFDRQEKSAAINQFKSHSYAVPQECNHLIKNYINFNRIVTSAFDFLDFLSLIEYFQNLTRLIRNVLQKKGFIGL